ncbi:tRNA-specific adenosine deaminase [bacterium]|nr:MAG: tRNA-specific adenosine deaminase [bacterium]
MDEALSEARKALDKGEFPVGCVIVMNGEIIGRGHNVRETTSNPTAHAEIIALAEAGKKIGNWRLDNADAYITLEPCPMCTQALILARIRKIIFGAKNSKLGACGTVWDMINDPDNISHPIVIQGVREYISIKLIESFVNSLRNKSYE